MRFQSPIFCAVDRPDLDGALDLAAALAGRVGGLKLGLEFVTANGPGGIRALAELGLPVFLDLKFHDIPNTVAGAVSSAARLDVAMLTVHAAGGLAMLRAAAGAASEAERKPWVLGVTVLTSLDQPALRATGVEGGLEDQVLRLADLSVRAGLDGVICSPHEIRALRRRFGEALKLVVPGIRPAGMASQDQARTLGPREAIAAGADLLVVGRAITGAPEPAAVAAAMAAEIAPTEAA